MNLTARSRLPFSLVYACCIFAWAGLAALVAESVPPTSQPVSPDVAGETLVYFGTFSRPPAGGIFVARLNATTGALSSASLAVKAESPGFLAVDPSAGRLYAIEDVPKDGATVGRVDAFDIDRETGQLTLKNQQTPEGGAFCYLALDRSKRFLGAARYNDGNAVILPLAADGKVQPVSSVIQHHGSGPNKERQDKPHVHSINFDLNNRFAFVADLGTDEISSYLFDASAGKLTLNDSGSGRVSPGSGPRHFAFHPSGKFAYAVCEMTAAVAAYHYDAEKGALSEIQVAPLLTPDLVGERRGAEVVVDRTGRFLYVSNRGYDALVVFAIDPTTGQLTFVQREHQGIAYPRNFAIDPSGRWLLCANRDSNSVTVYAIDATTGQLTLTNASAQVPRPVCVRFFPLQ